MTGGFGVAERGGGFAQRGGKGELGGTGNERICSRASTRKLKRYHRPELVAELSRGQFVVRVSGQTGEIDRGDARVARQERGRTKGVAKGAFGPQVEGSQSTGGQPGLERATCQAPGGECHGDPFPVCRASAEQTQHDIAVPINHFGGAFHDKIRTQRQRLAENRGHSECGMACRRGSCGGRLVIRVPLNHS